MLLDEIAAHRLGPQEAQLLVVLQSPRRPVPLNLDVDAGELAFELACLTRQWPPLGLYGINVKLSLFP